MKVYIVKKGTEVVLFNMDGNYTKVIAKADVDFVNFVDDTIYNHNQSIYNSKYIPSTPEKIRNMFHQYIAFPIDEQHTKTNYKFVAVDYHKVEVL